MAVGRIKKSRYVARKSHAAHSTKSSNRLLLLRNAAILAEPISTPVEQPILKRRFLRTFQHRSFLHVLKRRFLRTFQHRSFYMCWNDWCWNEGARTADDITSDAQHTISPFATSAGCTICTGNHTSFTTLTSAQDAPRKKELYLRTFRQQRVLINRILCFFALNRGLTSHYVAY